MGHNAGLYNLNILGTKDQPATVGAEDGPPSPDLKDPKSCGFCYLLDSHDGSRGTWDLRVSTTHDTLRTLRRLALNLPGHSNWEDDDNPRIPSGYTYLLQFVAHDVVLTTTPFWAAADLGVDSSNNRAFPLMLEALYGGGPQACPVAFKPPPGGKQNENEDRSRLRVGHIAGHPGGTDDPCPVRDLPRVNLDRIIPEPARNSNSVNFDQAHSVQVADARNDDNLILSQLVVLLSLAHNIICDNIASKRVEARFNYARAIMLRIYHRIIRCDLLPKLLHPDILKAMQQRYVKAAGEDPACRATRDCAGQTSEALDQDPACRAISDYAKKDWLWTRPGLPLEFSHGAFRVGHAMVRRHYTLNASLPAQDVVDIVTHNQQFAGGLRTPLNKEWVLQWSRFFGMGDGHPKPNYSRLISATKSSLDRGRLFPTPEASPPDGTSFRDLLSAAGARLPSVEALISAVVPKDLMPPAWYNENTRTSKIKTWLDDIRKLRDPDVRKDEGLDHLTDDDIEKLSTNPPLPLFILLEAELDRRVNGSHLGVLGSVIVGEVLFKLLADDAERVKRLYDTAENEIPGELRSRIEKINCMPGLVKFVEEFGEIGHCRKIPFV